MGNLLPRYRLFHGADRVVSCFRWMNLAWDAVWAHRKYFFIQYGHKPVFFVFYRRGGELPTFIISAAFKTVFCKGNLRAGIALKPKDIEKAWRRYESATGMARPRTGVEKRQGRMALRLDF